jgi:hypothetical protein
MKAWLNSRNKSRSHSQESFQRRRAESQSVQPDANDDDEEMEIDFVQIVYENQTGDTDATSGPPSTLMITTDVGSDFGSSLRLSGSASANLTSSASLVDEEDEVCVFMGPESPAKAAEANSNHFTAPVHTDSEPLSRDASPVITQNNDRITAPYKRRDSDGTDATPPIHPQTARKGLFSPQGQNNKRWGLSFSPSPERRNRSSSSSSPKDRQQNRSLSPNIQSRISPRRGSPDPNQAAPNIPSKSYSVSPVMVAPETTSTSLGQYVNSNSQGSSSPAVPVVKSASVSPQVKAETVSSNNSVGLPMQSASPVEDNNKFSKSSYPSHTFSPETNGSDMLSPDVRVAVHAETTSSKSYTTNPSALSIPSPPIVPSLSPVPEPSRSVTHASSLPYTKTLSMQEQNFRQINSDPEPTTSYALYQESARPSAPTRAFLRGDSACTSESVVADRPPLPPQREHRERPAEVIYTRKNVKRNGYWGARRNRGKHENSNDSFTSSPSSSYSSSLITSSETSGTSGQMGTSISAMETTSTIHKQNRSESHPTASFISTDHTSAASDGVSTVVSGNTSMYSQQLPTSNDSSNIVVRMPPSSQIQYRQQLLQQQQQQEQQEEHQQQQHQKPKLNKPPNFVPQGRIPPNSPLSMDSALMVKSPTVARLAAGQEIDDFDRRPDTLAEFLGRPALSPHSDRAAMKRAESEESAYYMRFNDNGRSPKSCKSPGGTTLTSIRSTLKSSGSHAWSLFGHPKTPDKNAMARQMSYDVDEDFSYGSDKRQKGFKTCAVDQISTKVPSNNGLGGCCQRIYACFCSKVLFYVFATSLAASMVAYSIVNRKELMHSMLDYRKDVTVAFVGNAYLYVNDVPRLMEAISGYHIHQSSVVHSGGSLAALSVTGSGMFPKWMTDEAAIDEAEKSNFSESDSIYDYGMCTVTQLLTGEDENLVYDNTNGYYYNDGHNPCLVLPGYLDFLNSKKENAAFKWDYVVLVDQTKRMAVEEARQDSVDALVEFYGPLLKASGARPIVVDTHSFWSESANMTGLGDIPQFQALIYDGVNEYVDALSSVLPRKQTPLVAPIGMAYLTVWEEDYSLWEKLFIDDEVHSSLIGSFLFSCVLYATIFGRLPSEEASRPENVQYLFEHSRKLIGQEVVYPSYSESEYLRNVAKRVVINGYIPSSLRDLLQ